MPNPSQELPACFTAQNEDLRHGCSLHLQNQDRSDNGCIKDQWPYPNQDQDAKPQDQCSDHMKILIKIQNPIQKLFQPKANHCKAELVLLLAKVVLWYEVTEKRNIFFILMDGSIRIVHHISHTTHIVHICTELLHDFYFW